MKQVSVEILIGHNAGQVRQLAAAPLGFGRAPDNAIVIDLPFISRHHAEIRRSSNGWELVNHSPNGTRIGKRLVKKQPRQFTDLQQIFVGETAVLRVVPGDLATESTDQADLSNQPGGSRSGMSGRAKLWTGIGVYLLLMLGLFIFFATLGDTGKKAPTTLAAFSKTQIRQLIRQPIVNRPANPQLAQQALLKANAMFHAIDSQPDALYLAYRAYRQAASYSPNHRLARPLDVGRYQSVRQWLVQRISNRYTLGMTYFLDGHYGKAAKTFADLAKMYPNYSSPLFENIQAHLDQAHGRAQSGR